MMRSNEGAATLLLTLVLATISTLIIVFAANYGRLQDKFMSNINRHYQAFEAAQAGLEFGINYLKVNNSTILANPVAGYIPAYSDSNTNNVIMGNSSKYTITYSNPIANNYTLIKVSSNGISDDGTSTHTVSQLVQFGSLLINTPALPLISKGEITLSGNSQIINTYSNVTVQTGESADMHGSSSTILNSGTSSTPGNIKSDIQQNVSSLANMSNNDFFSSYFGLSPTSIKSSVAHYYSNSSSTNYKNTLSGMTGTSIWIDQTNGTASLNGSVTIGSTTNPVLLIINGDVNFSGNVTIYGYVFILGSSETDLTGNVTIIGGMATTGEINTTGSIQIVYSPSVLTNLQNNSSMRYYAKVPGSWRDF
jgi:Tfp pilus assembly protein PilX